MANQWQVKRLAGALGAEVTNVDLTIATDADINQVNELLLEHKVLFFPGQTMSPEQHVAFGHNFGELEDHPNLKPVHRSPLYFELRHPRWCRGRVAYRHHLSGSGVDHVHTYMVKCPEFAATPCGPTESGFAELSVPSQQLCGAPRPCIPAPTVAQTLWRFTRWCGHPKPAQKRCT